MIKFCKTKFSMICAICLIICMVGGFTGTEVSSENPVIEPANNVVSGVSTAIEPTYNNVSMYINGIMMTDGFMVEDTTYIPLRTFFEAIGEQTDIAWDEETNTVTVTADDFEMTAIVETNYITANGRCFYVPQGVLNIDDIIAIPVRDLAKLYQVEVNWDDETASVSICADEPQVLESADTYYEEQDLYWLSRLINAESGNQPMEGKIGVGDVVINRVADPTCPDTIYGVIFDNKFGVQFSVTETGGIYEEPNEESIVAAKICLEGYNIVGDSIYFVNPSVGVSSWFADTRVFVATIGEHVFYA